MKEKNLLVATMALLERENAVSIPQLARLLNATEDEVWNALDVLVFCYDAVSVRLDLHEAHASLEKTGTDRLLRLNREETGVLLDALAAQGFSPDDELCAKLLAAKGFLGAADDGRHPPKASVQLADTGNENKVVELIAAACDDPDHHLLSIEYQKDGAARPEERTVEPRAIVSEGGHLYLRAWCRKANGRRSFRIDRVKSARALDATFAPRDMAQDADEDARTVARVRFAPGTPLPDWPGLGRPRTGDDGSLDAPVPWFGGRWLPKHIVGMQGDAVPLEPPELVEETRAYARELIGEKPPENQLA